MRSNELVSSESSGRIGGCSDCVYRNRPTPKTWPQNRSNVPLSFDCP
jgi:hypothetical protein